MVDIMDDSDAGKIKVFPALERLIGFSLVCRLPVFCLFVIGCWTNIAVFSTLQHVRSVAVSRLTKSVLPREASNLCSRKGRFVCTVSVSFPFSTFIGVEVAKSSCARCWICSGGVFGCTCVSSFFLYHSCAGWRTVQWRR